MKLYFNFVVILMSAVILYPNNSIAQSVHSYAYDAQGRLIDVRKGEGFKLNYQYDR